MKINLNYYLVNIGAFFCTLPFVAPFPLGSDVQYPIFILCSLVIFNDFFIKGQIRFRKLELYFLIVALISFVYINPFNDYDYYIFKRVGLLFGFLVFYVYSRYWHIVKPRYILAGIYVNFIAAITHFMFTDLFANIAGNITRVIKIKDLDNPRGVSGLAPEPGFLGAMCAFFILISYILLNEKKISKNKFVFVVFLSVIMMLMTKSGTAIIFLYLLLGLFFLFSRYTLWKKIWAGTWIMLFLTVFIYHSGLSGRGISIARNLIENPKQVFGYDISVAQREIAISVGILSMVQGNILGHGVGTLSYVADNIISESFLATNNKYARARDILNVRTSSNFLLSSFAQYTVELGLIFIILLIWLYFNVDSQSYVKIVRVTSLLYLVASFSILFPPFWLLLASTDIRNSSCLYFHYRPLKSQIQ